jgi:hypothetical protein
MAAGRVKAGAGRWTRLRDPAKPRTIADSSRGGPRVF